MKMARYKLRSPSNRGDFSGFFIQPQSEPPAAYSHPTDQPSAKRDLALLQPQSTCRPRTAPFIARVRIRSPIHLHSVSPTKRSSWIKTFPITNSLDSTANSGKGRPIMPGRRYAFREASKNGSKPQNENVQEKKS